jgi:hypothetical protein
VVYPLIPTLTPLITNVTFRRLVSRATLTS